MFLFTAAATTTTTTTTTTTRREEERRTFVAKDAVKFIQFFHSDLHLSQPIQFFHWRN